MRTHRTVKDNSLIHTINEEFKLASPFGEIMIMIICGLILGMIMFS